jgi:hypothetical protein
MTSVQTLPRFKKGDILDYFGDPANFDPDPLEGPPSDGQPVFMATCTVEDRYHAPGAGWIYRMSGVAGLVEERWLAVTDGKTTAASNRGIHEIINLKDMLEAFALAPYKVGDIFRGLELSDLDDVEDESVDTYFMVTGLSWYEQDVLYICALRHEDGRFLDVGADFYIDEMAPLTDIERARFAAAPPRARPTLRVIHSPTKEATQ